MAITKATRVQRCEVYSKQDASAADTLNEAWPTITVVYEDMLDDPDDAELPVTATRVKNLQKFTLTPAETEGDPAVSTATVISGEDALVQSICGVVWS